MERRKLLLIGLGNKDRKYWHTRHNAGTLILSSMIRYISKNQENLDKKIKIEYSIENTNKQVPNCFITIDDLEYEIICNVSNMNSSGIPIYKHMIEQNIGPSNIVVFHDDLNLKFGSWKVRLSNGSGGHNGLRSINQVLRGEPYKRFAFGIGRPANETEEISDFVLGPFSESELDVIDKVARDIVQQNILELFFSNANTW